MKFPRDWRAHAVLAIVLGLMQPDDAQAYLDPGTGSYLLQILLAGLFDALYAIKHFWGRIKLFLQGILGRGETPADGIDEQASSADD